MAEGDDERLINTVVSNIVHALMKPPRLDGRANKMGARRGSERPTNCE
jgi:hypothetical protein